MVFFCSLTVAVPLTGTSCRSVTASRIPAPISSTLPASVPTYRLVCAVTLFRLRFALSVPCAAWMLLTCTTFRLAIAASSSSAVIMPSTTRFPLSMLTFPASTLSWVATLPFETFSAICVEVWTIAEYSVLSADEYSLVSLSAVASIWP